MPDLLKRLKFTHAENGEKKTQIIEVPPRQDAYCSPQWGDEYLHGKIPTIAIMKITGQKTYKEIMKYPPEFLRSGHEE